MDILVITNMYPSKEKPYYGVFVKNTVNTLEQHGFSTSVLTVNSKSLGIINKVLSYFVFYFKVFISCLFSSADKIYVNYVSHCSLPVLLAYYLRRHKIVSHVHGGDVKYHTGRSKIFFKIKRFFSKKLLSLSEYIIVPSNYYKTFIQENYNFKGKVVVYPSGGIDNSVFNVRRNLDCDIRKIGFAGRLEKTKNVETVLEVFKEICINKPNLVCEIVGDGTEKTFLLKKAEKLGISKRINFFSSMNQDELSDWYNSLDILMYPSESESLGLVPLEAMACGAIPLLSDIPAFKEYINGNNGFICKSPSGYIDQINTLFNLSNNELRSLRETTARFVTENYDSRVVARGLINVFK